jgi:hypothetical protein
MRVFTRDDEMELCESPYFLIKLSDQDLTFATLIGSSAMTIIGAVLVTDFYFHLVHHATLSWSSSK